MSDDPDLVRTLTDFAAAARDLDLRWYLFGARAVAAWGCVRATHDVDVTVDLGDRPTLDLFRRLESAGFERRFSYDDAFVARVRVLPMVHRETRMAMDVVLSGPGIEEEFHSSAVAVRFGPTEVPVISPEDLVVTKVLSGRPKDLDDVDAILRARGASLDSTRVRGFLSMLESALARSDLLPALEAAIERTRLRGPRRG